MGSKQSSHVRVECDSQVLQTSEKKDNLHVDVVKSDGTTIASFTSLKPFITVGSVAQFVTAEYRGHLETSDGRYLVDPAARLPPGCYIFRISKLFEKDMELAALQQKIEAAQRAAAQSHDLYCKLKAEKMKLKCLKISGRRSGVEVDIDIKL